MLVDGVLVEFTPQPLSLDPTEITTLVSFSVRVEGYGQMDYARVGAGTRIGIAISGTESFSEAITFQPNDPWPNIRTEFFPCRLSTRLRSARVVITDLMLAEINRVTLLGKVSPLDFP